MSLNREQLVPTEEIGATPKVDVFCSITNRDAVISIFYVVVLKEHIGTSGRETWRMVSDDVLGSAKQLTIPEISRRENKYVGQDDKGGS